MCVCVGHYMTSSHLPIRTPTNRSHLIVPGTAYRTNLGLSVFAKDTLSHNSWQSWDGTVKPGPVLQLPPSPHQCRFRFNFGRLDCFLFR